MKNYILLIVASILLSSCNEETRPQLPPGQYQVNVNAPGVLNGIRAYIKGVDQRNRQVFIDTAVVINETFTFTGSVNAPAMRLISVNGIQNNLSFILEEGFISINLDKETIQNSTIDGPINNQGFAKYNSEFNQLSDEVTNTRLQIRQARSEGNNQLAVDLSKKNMELTQGLRSYTHDFIDDNADMNFSLLLLETLLAGGNQDVERIKGNMDALSGVIASNPQNQLIAQKINTFIAMKEAQAMTEIGKVAPNFTSVTPNGETLSLNEIKGKATIIDFWASWCGPCRRENPNIVRVYEKYHDKGLEIIGVSLDRPGQKQRWIDAIEKDNLNWHQVGSMQYFNDPVAKMYNVNSIPAAFILDETGTIVAKRLRGVALENKIAELLE